MDRIYHRRTQRTPRTAGGTAQTRQTTGKHRANSANGRKHGADSANNRKTPGRLPERRMKRNRFRERQPKTPHPRSEAASTRPVPRNEIPRTAPTIGSGKHPTGSAQRDTAHRTPRSDARNTLPQRGHTRGPRANEATARPRPEKPAKRGKYGRRKGPDLRPGPCAHALGRLPWLAGFPARERRLRPRRLIVAPQIDCAPERHTTDRKCISRRRRPLCAATTASRPIRPAHPPRHERPVKPHPVQLWSSCFSRPAPLVLRLFPVAPKKARALACPRRREESWCAGERQKGRRIPAFHGRAFRMENALRARTAHKRGLSTSGTLHTRPRIDLEPLEEKGPPRWPKR